MSNTCEPTIKAIKHQTEGKKEKKKKNSTHFPSMAVCYATAGGPKKGKRTRGVENSQ